MADEHYWRICSRFDRGSQSVHLSTEVVAVCIGSRRPQFASGEQATYNFSRRKVTRSALGAIPCSP